MRGWGGGGGGWESALQATLQFTFVGIKAYKKEKCLLTDVCRSKTPLFKLSNESFYLLVQEGVGEFQAPLSQIA